MRKSSNTSMEEKLSILEQIQRVSPRADLFDQIEKRIERERNQTIPYYRVALVAALFVSIFCLEIYFVSEAKNEQENAWMNQIVNTSSNSLYHE